MSEALTIYLLCHNRPKMAIEALNSILSQTSKKFHLVVSDNSTNRDLLNILQSEYPDVALVSWYPGLPVFDHFNKILSTVKSKYFVMFHDDDVMEPNYVETMLRKIVEYPNAVAIGTNAHQIDETGDRSGSQTWFQGSSTGGDRTLCDRHELLLQYLVVDRGGVAPFPSYVYNSELVRGLLMNVSTGRAYCDTVYLLEIMKRGPLVWINEPLLRVRVHQTNQSNYCAVRDYKNFVSWARREFGATLSDYQIDEYRIPRLYLALRSRKRLPSTAIIYFLRAMPRLLIRSRSFRHRVWKQFTKQAKSWSLA